MPTKKWDKYEAAILLDGYLKVQSGEIERKKAIKEVSQKLRSRAENSGEAIDDIFRNEAGITFQMHSMESAYIGYTKMKPASQLFLDIVKLYNENRSEFNTVLQEALMFGSANESLKEKFFEWLNKKTSAAKMSELENAFLRMEEYCLERNILKKPLFETTDLTVLGNVRKTVESSKIFRFKNKSYLSKMSSGIRHYIEFVKTEAYAEANAPEKVEEIVLGIDELQVTDENENINADLPIENSSNEVYQSISGDRRKLDFGEWMISNGSSDGTVRCYTSSLSMGGSIALQNNIINQDIFTVADADTLRRAFDLLVTNKEFVDKNIARHNQLSAAMIKYIQFVEDKDFVPSEKNIEKKKTVQTRHPRIVENHPRKEEFIEWMISNDSAERTASSYASNLGLVGELGLDAGLMQDSVWEITDTEELKNIITELLKNQEFIEKNESRHNQFRAAFVKYIQFCGDSDFTLGRGPRQSATGSILVDEDVKEEYPELYMRLHSMSKVYDDPAGVSADFIYNMLGMPIEKDELIDILNRISWITEVAEGTYSFSKFARPYERCIEFDKNAFTQVLKQCYRNGMRFDSIDFENYRDSYNDIYDNELDMNDKDLEICLRKCGVVYQNRLFPAESIISDSVLERLMKYICDCFAGGKTVLYYKAIYADLSDLFASCYNLTDAKMLKPFLEYVTENEEYFFTEEYMSKERNVRIDHKAEIEEFLISEGKPLSYDEIYAGISHISKDVILTEIRANSNIICNEKEHYFHYDIFEFSSEDADKITEYIQKEINEEGYCIWNRVFRRIQSEMPIFIENNSYLSSLGVRNAVAKKLVSRFKFDGEVVGPWNQNLNMSVVYRLFAEHHAPFSDIEIYEFSKEINGGVIYFDALAEKTVRVSHELFVPKNQIEFDVEATDKALATYLTTGYMPIKDVDSFLTFPNVGYEWNSFLLESYLLYYSRDYALSNNGSSLNNVAGALVKRKSGYDDFEDVCADVLAHGYVDLTNNKALDYLANLNLLTRRSYAGIDRAISKAKQIRNKRG